MDIPERAKLASHCRICMKKIGRTGSVNIYSPSATGGTQALNLYEMLRTICAPVFGAEEYQDIKESSEVPRSVCSGCKRRIVSAYDLYKECIETDRKLRELLVVKQELKDSDIDDDGLLVEAKALVDFENDEGEDKEDVRTEPMLVDTHVEDLDEHDKRVKKNSNPCKRTCPLCSKVFKTIREMKTHMKEVHLDEVYCCGTCEEVFLEDTQRQEHELTHTTDRPHECSYCKEKFRSPTDLRYHTMNHTNDHPFRCSECGKGFPKKYALQEHMLRHTSDKAFVCGLCPSRFHTKGELKKHMVTHTLERSHVCDICGNRFTTNASMMKHVRRVHTGERRFHCNLCTLKFDNAYLLKRHMRTHTGEKPYKCAYCDRAYAQSNDLVKHSKTHVGENPYACDRCDAAFRLMTELRNHYKVHFQPGDPSSASDFTGIGGDKQQPVQFTSVATLNRRFEKEKQRGKQEMC